MNVGKEFGWTLTDADIEMGRNPDEWDATYDFLAEGEADAEFRAESAYEPVEKLQAKLNFQRRHPRMTAPKNGKSKILHWTRDALAHDARQGVKCVSGWEFDGEARFGRYQDSKVPSGDYNFTTMEEMAQAEDASPLVKSIIKDRGIRSRVGIDGQLDFASYGTTNPENRARYQLVK